MADICIAVIFNIKYLNLPVNKILKEILDRNK